MAVRGGGVGGRGVGSLKICGQGGEVSSQPLQWGHHLLRWTAPLPSQRGGPRRPHSQFSLPRGNFSGTPRLLATAALLGAPTPGRPPAHLSRVLLAHEPGGRLLGQAALVQPQPLHVAVGGDALRLRGALHFLDLHLVPVGSPDQRGKPGASNPRPEPRLPCGRN